MEVLTKPLSDSKQSANKELRHALRLCVEQMCDRCREAADALTSSVPCLSGCETLKIAKAALAEPPRYCDVLTLNAARKVWFAKEIVPRLDGDLPLGKEVPFVEWFVSKLEQDVK